MNPYIVGHPIKNQADFYGRSLEVSRFYEVIAGQQAQSLSVLGARRAGKTSFLLHVSQPAIKQQYLAEPAQTAMIYLDMSFCRTPAEFYGRFAQQLRQTLAGRHEPRRTHSAHTATVYAVEDLLCQFAGQRVVLLLDEFDQLRTGSFDENFLNELRSLITHWEYEMACVTASYWNLYQLGSHIGLPPTSPFYNIFYPSPIYIAGLDEEEQRRLICQPAQQIELVVEQLDIVSIQELAGTLPFFVQATAVSWFRQQQTGYLADFDEQLFCLADELSPYFEQWWRVLDEAEQGLLHWLVQPQPAASVPDMFAQARLRLLRYGLIVGRGEETAVNGAIFAHWLQTASPTLAATPLASYATPDLGTLRRTLRQTLVRHFSMEELNLLSFDLGMDFEQFPGQTKGAKARDLVTASERRGVLDQLLEAIRAERGDVVV